VDLDKEMRDFLYRLKTQYLKINLWYSGGIDSHFLLRGFINHDVPLDEIFIIKQMPFDDHAYSKITCEALYTAIPYLDTIQDYIIRHNVKTTQLTFGSRENEQYYRDPSWIQHTHSGEMRNASYVSQVIKQFNIDITASVCHLTGSETPFFFYDQGWKFYFIDQQIDVDATQIKPTTHDAVFLEAYVNAVLDQLELYPDYKTRFAEKNSAYRSTEFKRILPQMQEANATVWGQFPKFGFNVSSDSDFITRVNTCSFKNQLDYRSAKELNPKWFQDYCQLTDWKMIEKIIKFPGVSSQTFKIH
jgi:hypothetical protein